MGIEENPGLHVKFNWIVEEMKKFNDRLNELEKAMYDGVTIKEAINLGKGIRDAQLGNFVELKTGGCSQFTYCNECMAHPMGYGCENPNRKEYKFDETEESSD